MNEEAGFLAAIRANPRDDSLRLVYADWLDERGRPESAYLRLECELAARASTPSDPVDPGRWELRSALREARTGLDPQWVAAVSRVLLNVPFAEDPGASELWRGIFEDWLQLANEPLLWNAATGERYRYLTSTGGPGTLFRIEADEGETVSKWVESAPVGWALREQRRPLATGELVRLRRLIERTEFWVLPSPNPRFNLGLDGAHVLFEARVGARHHFVHRWSPDRGGFARLCRHVEAILFRRAESRRSWWRFW
jgi:uncharacterized protein (TIGR02996 family)